MCGVFAVSSLERADAGALALQGLKRLEYRGYDSWGFAIRKTVEEPILIQKDIGKISDVKLTFPDSASVIGHSRWATHGGVTKENAHPHQVGKVTLVHNGICENYLELKEKYGGHDYASETDTEVIAVVLNHFITQGHAPDTAIRLAAEQIEGRYAFICFIQGTAGIFAARRGSPLILGRNKTETYIASDIPAFLSETNVVNYLDDDELVHIYGGAVAFHSLTTGKPITKRDVTVQWQVQEAEKGDFDHFMMKEITDQKETLHRAIDHTDAQMRQAVDLLRECNGAYFIACGTAHKAAMVAEYFFADVSRRKVNIVAASEMSHFRQFINDRTALIAVSQSGETADVLEELEYAKKEGAKILSLTNVESSTMARMSDVHLPINAGPEKAVASTKAATSQMALLLLLAYADAGRLNEGREALRTVAGNVNDMINPRYEDHIRTVAESVVHHDNLFIIGRGTLAPMAYEAAIKIQEVSYIHAQGFPASELKHGPIALIEPGCPVVVLGDDPETLSNAQEVKARGAHVIGISPVRAEVFDQWIRVPNCGIAQCIATIIPIQILSYHLAVLRGVDPDMPRNLAKSVTVK